MEGGKRDVNNGQDLWAHVTFSKPDAETETFCSVQAESNSSPSKDRLWVKYIAQHSLSVL